MCFYRAMLCRARWCHSTSSVNLSVRPSVTFRYGFHIGWHTSTIISRPNSLRHLLKLTLTSAIWSKRNIPKIGWKGGKIMSRKACNISEMVQERTKVTMTDRQEVAYTLFRLVPKSMTLDNFERPKRHFCRNKKVYEALQKNVNEDRPLISAA